MRLRFYQTVSPENPPEDTAVREDAEHAARVDEADPRAERARFAAQPVEQAAERLGCVDRIEHEPLGARNVDQGLERPRLDLGASRALIAVEQPDLARHLYGQAIPAPDLTDDARDVLAHTRGLPRDRHAHDLGAQPAELTRHAEPRPAPPPPPPPSHP